MANLVYRKSSTPAANVSTTFKGSPLTNDELDNNLFGINAEVQLKAPINNAVFTGTTTIPSITATGGSINNITIGASGASTGAFTTLTTTGDVNVDGGDITTAATTFNLLNATATTVNFAGAGTAVTIGATTGTATIRNATLAVTNAATVGTTLGVTGNVTIGASKFVVTAATGNTAIAGDVAVDTNKFTVAAATGNTAVLGTFSSGGLSTLNSLTVTNASTLSGGLSTTTGSFSGQVTSTVAIGTAPFVVTSTTKVTNLNADRVDDFTADQANTASAIVVRDASKNINISNAVMSGSTSGTTTLQPTAISGTSVLTLPAATDTLVGKATTDTLTNKSFSLASNTLTGTLALFNTALTDADFVSIAGAETLTSKTLTSPVINTATISDGTINNTIIGGTTRAAGSFTTLNANSTLDVTGATTLSSTLAVNGASLTTTATTFNLINATATTLNLGGAATTITVGAVTGTTTVRNNASITGTLGVTGTSALAAVTATTGSFSGQVTSTVAIGTAPFVVTSTTRVTNLNADRVDDFTADQANTASNIVVRDASKNIFFNNAVMSGSTSGTTTLQPTAISGTSVLTLPAATDTLVGKATTDTFTNKSVNLASNTLTGTLAQFNTALSDADFASIAGIETLTNKTVNLTSNTLTGTLAQFNTALSDADFVSIAGIETITNKTLTSPAINTATISGGTINNAIIGGTTRAAGSFTTLNANSTLDVTGVTTLSSLGVGASATIGNTLAVTGDVSVNTNKFNVTALSGNTAIAGTLGVAGNVAVATNKFTIAAGSGDTVVAGTLNVSGTSTLAGVNAGALSASSLTSSAGVQGTTLTSTVAIGTAPLTVTSTTRVTNLNADTVDGMNFATVNVGGVLNTDQRGGVAYASDASNITYVAPGTSGYLLQSNGLNSAPTWVAANALTAGNSSTAANVLGGAAGSILYQSAVDNTAKLAIGSTGQILTAGATLPEWSSSISVSGTLTHGGLTPSAGTNIDQLYTATDATLVVTTSWVSTSVNFAELATGSYMVQVNTGTEYYTGIMSWYGADINSVVTDEIILHRASSGAETSNLFLKVERTDTDLDPAGAASPNMTLQISSSVARASASYTYKFRRMI
jgi:hypothetical protein